jgi:hypothetical protein
MASQDSSRIVQRALVLLIVLGAVAVSVLSMRLRGTAPAIHAELRAEQLASLVCMPAAAFPASVGWPAAVLFADALPSPPGWEIRYTATEVLARRGSACIPLDILCEMLDEDRQMRNFRTRLKDGRDVANETRALNEIIVALNATALWHKHADVVEAVGSENPDLEKLYRAVDKLTRSSNNVVRARAQATLLALKKK